MISPQTLSGRLWWRYLVGPSRPRPVIVQMHRHARDCLGHLLSVDHGFVLRRVLNQIPEQRIVLSRLPHISSTETSGQCGSKALWSLLVGSPRPPTAPVDARGRVPHNYSEVRCTCVPVDAQGADSSHCDSTRLDMYGVVPSSVKRRAIFRPRQRRDRLPPTHLGSQPALLFPPGLCRGSLEGGATARQGYFHPARLTRMLRTIPTPSRRR